MLLLKRLLAALKSPVTVGLIATGLTVGFAYQYYQLQHSRTETVQSSGLFELMTWVDQKFADLRMNARGPKPNADTPVAILAIDDQSLEEIGRWPWSRKEIARLVDETMSHGAKVIGFDMIFSEPERTAGADESFAQVIAKHKEGLVMGAYYDSSETPLAPYQEVCYHRAFKSFPYFQIVERMARPPMVLDSESAFEPLTHSLSNIFDPLFEGIGDGAAAEFVMGELALKTPEEWTYQDKVRLERKRSSAVLNYCGRWLSAGQDEAYEFFEEHWGSLLSESHPEFVKEDFASSVQAFKEAAHHNVIPATGRWWVNIPKLSNEAIHTAFFNAELDSDGTIRSKPLIYRAAGHYVPSLALQSYLVGTDSMAQIFVKNQQDMYGRIYKVVEEFRITDLEGELKFKVPVDEKGKMRINYAGPRNMYPHLRASELFRGEDEVTISIQKSDPETHQLRMVEEKVNKAQFLKDRIFIVGATAMGVYDLRVTPFEKNYPGVETHANIIGNLIDQDFLKAYPDEEHYMLAALTLMGVVLSFVVAFLGAFWGMLITLGSLFAVYVVDLNWIYGQGYVVSIGFPLILIGFLYISMTFYKYFTEERKKKHLRSTFSKYVSPAIVDEILKDPSNVELGGKKIRMTVFFSDVRGFTSISEKLDPVALSKLLSDYLTPMTDIVFDNKGTLDKYMGDAIMAFFGAPIYFDDHAASACRCALQSLEKLKELQREFESQGLPKIDIGIGMNSAEMSVGNMGSNIVRNYTVMGDAVNLASRLEGINKQYGTRIIISEFTYEDIKADFTTREIDWVRVKGKNEPIRIFELICEGAAEGDQARVLEHFNRGFQHYHAQEFAAARMEFQSALSIDPEDEPSKLYIERCQGYAESPPSDTWDGVFVMNSK